MVPTLMNCSRALAWLGILLPRCMAWARIFGKDVVSGAPFLLLYFAVLALINLAFPGYVESAWNLRVIAGVRLLGVPLEYLMFAFTLGLYWSSTYEHITPKCDMPLAEAVAAAVTAIRHI